MKLFILLLIVALLVGVGFLPLVVMFIQSITVDGHLSTSAYPDLFSSGRQWRLLQQSLTLAFLTTVLATGVGLPLGILFGKSDLPFRRGFAVLFIIPLCLPPYITAVAWFNLLGREGVLARVMGSGFLIPIYRGVVAATSAWLFGLPGCVLVLSITFMPIVMVLTMTYLKTVNPHLEAQAKLVARWPLVLLRVTLPLILPGVFLAAILVFLLTFGEFSVPMFLRYDVFPVESFTQFSAFHDPSAATAAAIPLGLMTFLVLIVERLFLREKTYQLRPAASEAESLRIRLGRARPWLFAPVSLLCLLAIGMPFLVLVVRSASVSAYFEAFARAGDSLARSLLYAAIGASVLTVLGFFSGYLIHSRAFRFWGAVDSLTLFLFALPSTVIGVGLISLWNRPSTQLIYGTPAVVLLGYLAQYTALTSRITVSTLAQIPPSMTEAARVVGAKWLRCVILILAPLAKRGLIAGWLVGYLFCLRDTGISMMVYPPGQDPLTVRTFTLMANGSAELIAALCVVMILATLTPLGVLGFIFNPKKQAR
ncbi:iron ABC transporter permease [Candidatus Poribacteria bacterium]|nr:iron ABC transporter permease [Candidatus Poribacteria bacterium]